MKKNLYLDDERATPPDYIRVYTYQEAVKELLTGDYKLVSLDHDLGTAMTGYDVASWIEYKASTGDLTRLVWIVHSANPVGALRMRQALLSADRFWDILEFDPCI